MIRSGSGRERRTNAVIAVLTVLAIPAALIVAGWALVSVVLGDGDPPNCDGYTFDEEAWNVRDGAGPEEEAAALAECDTLDGKPRAEVRELLGEPNGRHHEGASRWAFSAGWVDDGIGIGDGQTLIVRFDENDRVTSADVRYPPNYD